MQHPRTTAAARRAAAGFTLIEMLAVMVILSLLVAFLVSVLRGASDVADEELTEGILAQISAALAEYEGDVGDYPSSRYPADVAGMGDKVNEGIEALVVQIFSTRFDGLGLSDDLLANTDGDSARAGSSTLGAELFELVDLWGNPIAYFHRSDYGRPQVYVTFDGSTGEAVESDVVARKHPVTGRWANRDSFQLISAGLDGVFGTEDDIANFDTGG